MKREEKGNNHNKTDNTHNNNHARTGSHTHLGGKVEQVIKKFGGSLHNAKTAVNHHKQTDSSTHNPDNDLELRTLIGLIESTQENTAILHLNNLDIDVINREIKGGKTLLHLAAKHELDFLVKELLVKMEQTFIERKDITGKTALHYAAISGNKTVVELLIPKIPFKDVGAFDASGKTALHYVIKNTGNYGQEREVSERTYKEIVEMLIKRMPLESIKASTRDNTGKTALQLAIDHNKQEAAKLLHTKIGFTDIAYVSKSDGKTALHSALLYKQEEVADLLWKKIVDSKNNRDITIKDIEKLINHSDEKGSTLLHCAIKGNIPSIAGNIITFLSSHKIITQEDNEGTTPLILATQNEDFKDAAMTMIAKFPKALIGAKVDGNLSVAHYAAREGNEKVLEQLVKNQPKHVQIIEFTTKDGNTLLHYAALNGHLEAVNFLISKMHPGLIKVPNKNGYTALHYAAQIGHTEVVGALLESMDGKNISAATYKSHYTPLMLAINKNHEEVAKMLVSKMSVKDLKIIDRHGNTATDLATKKDFGDLASLINDKIGHSHHHHDSEGKGKQPYYESDGENTTTPTNVKFKLSTPVGQQPHTTPIQHQWKELATKAVALQQEKKDLSTNTTKKTSATETTRGLIDKAEDALKTVTSMMTADSNMQKLILLAVAYMYKVQSQIKQLQDHLKEKHSPQITEKTRDLGTAISNTFPSLIFDAQVLGYLIIKVAPTIGFQVATGIMNAAASNIPGAAINLASLLSTLAQNAPALIQNIYKLSKDIYQCAEELSGPTQELISELLSTAKTFLSEVKSLILDYGEHGETIGYLEQQLFGTTKMAFKLLEKNLAEHNIGNSEVTTTRDLPMSEEISTDKDLQGTLVYIATEIQEITKNGRGEASEFITTTLNAIITEGKELLAQGNQEVTDLTATAEEVITEVVKVGEEVAQGAGNTVQGITTILTQVTAELEQTVANMVKDDASLNYTEIGGETIFDSSSEFEIENNGEDHNYNSATVNKPQDLTPPVITQAALNCTPDNNATAAPQPSVSSSSSGWGIWTALSNLGFLGETIPEQQLEEPTVLAGEVITVH